jgi:outer membrane protein assembly factor BamB
MPGSYLPRAATLATALLLAAACSRTHHEGGGAGNPAVAAQAQAPLLALLPQFTAPDVPALGPAEPGPTPRSWPDPTSAPSWPGNGIGQHPMLYAGEGYNTIFLVNQGKVIWTYSTGKGGEIDDVWLMTNGHILFARQFHVEEVTPKKEIVWHYDAPPGTEVHSCQPIGLDKVLLVQNGLPPKLMVIDKKSGAVEVEHELPAVSLTDPKTVHPQFRRIRMTAQGTYLAPFLKMAKVIEYDKDFKPIWSYDIPTPWHALRLHNGNTMIVDEHDRLVREVSPKGETVWEIKQADLPANIVLHNIQTAERLANGNTVIFSSTGGTKKEDRPSIIQLLEVTPDKRVVWVLQDWKNLGPATTAQFLDQPGIPERPGDLQH